MDNTNFKDFLKHHFEVVDLSFLPFSAENFFARAEVMTQHIGSMNGPSTYGTLLYADLVDVIESMNPDDVDEFDFDRLGYICELAQPIYQAWYEHHRPLARSTHHE